MTRKDYVKIAAALKRVRPHLGQLEFPSRLAAWRNCVTEVSLMLQDDNPRFDLGRFNEATGYGETLELQRAIAV